MSQHGDGGKGSQRRPGQGFEENFDRIFGKRPLKPESAVPQKEPEPGSCEQSDQPTQSCRH